MQRLLRLLCVHLRIGVSVVVCPLLRAIALRNRIINDSGIFRHALAAVIALSVDLGPAVPVQTTVS